MRFKDFIAKVNPQPRPVVPKKEWKKGVKYRFRGTTRIADRIITYNEFTRFQYPDDRDANRLIVIGEDNYPLWADNCELL